MIYSLSLHVVVYNVKGGWGGKKYILLGTTQLA